MATLSTDHIEGFSDMSAEEQVAALLNVDIPEPQVDRTKWVPKEMFDKKAAEAAAYNKQLKAQREAAGKISEEEQRKAADDEQKFVALEEQVKALKEANEALMRQNAVANHTSELLKLSYDEKSAGELAEALVGGDTKKVFSLMAAHDTAMRKAFEAERMKSIPQPSGTATSDGETALDLEIAHAIGKDYSSAAGASMSIVERFGRRT